ncbi:unnamed protein product [Didymodactylos carnosus]|uniref:Uncharacterized protein n=1 Tax=Didymodactylos carnosus TaxID=1234261 RepID=A0A8S2G6Q1_9BILA|nr:unnamed protein product [Didymodactylos carnosus]CAF4466890.1 unnamed protein product [Didymodactylos carnosus]
MYYIHDILVCIVQNNYKYKYVQLTNDNGIESKPIWIDEDDTIIWEWDTKKKQSITQVDSYRNNDNDQYTEFWIPVLKLEPKRKEPRFLIWMPKKNLGSGSALRTEPRFSALSLEPEKNFSDSNNSTK